MSTKNLKKHIKRKRFRPSTIATTDDRRFRINHELDIEIYKRKKRSQVVILGDGVIYVLEPEQICGVRERV